MTPGIDQLIAAGIKRDVAELWLVHVQTAMSRFGIESERQVAAWLAQTAHESGGYTMLTENLNYRAATMAVCWPKRFAEIGPDGKPKRSDKGALVPNKFALALERKPEAIANVVYASRMGNGPVESGEGWLYRGRGLKQLTGKDNVARCSQALGIDFVKTPDLLIEPEFAALSAAWFWNVNKCGALADADDFVGLTKKINGGTIGLEDRQHRYKAVLASLGI
jgi:putative chitinase